MLQYRHEAFIDGSNFFATIKYLGMRVDYARLRSYLFGTGITRINYLTAIHEDSETGHRQMQSLVDWLSYNGYNIISKMAKEKINAEGVRHIKGNMDVEIAVAAMQAAEYCADISLFTGDGDFVSLVKALQARGVTVTVYSSIKTNPSIIADELRRVVDIFIDIADISQYIEQKAREENTNV